MIDPGKPQVVRLLDVFFIGPLMTWGGVLLSRDHKVAGPILAFLGVATVGYNGYNWLRYRS